MGSDIGFVGLAASVTLVLVAIGISAWRKLGLEANVAFAALRAALQLLAVGLVLDLVIDPKRPLILSWVWVVGMIGFAAYTTGRRAPEVPHAARISVVAYTLSSVVCLGVLFGLRIFPMNGRTIVPIAGLVVGNALSSTVLVARRIVAEMSEKREEIEARLALGLTSTEAGRPYLRFAVRTALIPQIETTKAVGIVFLPGAMVGLILAGAKPLGAVKVQAAVMYVVLASVTTTTTAVAIGLSRQLFTKDHRLVRLARERS
ncbi:MAG: iron export ABC transporter permease subunit FetB [Acidimicrobiales bacterium]